MFKKIRLFLIRRHLLKPTTLFPKVANDWDELAAWHGVSSGAVYKDQCDLADSIIEEIFREEALNEKRDS